MTRRAALRCALLGLAAWRAMPVLAALPAPAPAPGAVWRVGPGGEVARFAEAVRRAADGDQIQVLPGDYFGDVAVIHQRRLHIVGIGAQPQFHGDGRHAEGKAIWVVRNGDIRIDNIGFRGARVPDGNGAGIRFERGRLRLHRCRFIDNEMGLLCGNDAGSSLRITDCEFAEAPPGRSALHHLLYVGLIGTFSVSGSHFGRGHVGHLIKSRARRSLIAYNCIVDGALGSASYEIDLPNGGEATVIGNLIGQSAMTENNAMLAFGAEGRAWPNSVLRLAFNSFVDDLGAGAHFVRAWPERLPDDAPIVALNNLLIGDGDWAPGPLARSIGNLQLPRRLLPEDAASACALAPTDDWRGRAAELPPDLVALRPDARFTAPLGTRRLAAPAVWSPGAFQS